MSRRQIAPQLEALVKLKIYTGGGGLIGMRGATAELRALLALANAVGRAKHHAWHGPWEHEIHRAFDAHDRLRALARLDRAGRTK